METPPSLQRIINLALQQGRKVAHIDTIYLPFFQKVLTQEYPQLTIKTERTRNEIPTVRIELQTKNP
jgi:hypothetical protein